MARSSIISHPLSRRQVLKGGAALGIGSAAAMGLTPAWANPWGRTNVYAQGVEEGPRYRWRSAVNRCLLTDKKPNQLPLTVPVLPR